MSNTGVGAPRHLSARGQGRPEVSLEDGVRSYSEWLKKQAATSSGT